MHKSYNKPNLQCLKYQKQIFYNHKKIQNMINESTKKGSAHQK